MTVPGTGLNSRAALVVQATDRPMRVMVDNVGPNPLRLAFASGSVASFTADGADHYQLGTGQNRVFVLAPQQRFYAVAIGATGQLSVATSDALPLDIKI